MFKLYSIIATANISVLFKSNLNKFTLTVNVCFIIIAGII